MPKRCKNCGAQVEEAARICPSCNNLAFDEPTRIELSNAQLQELTNSVAEHLGKKPKILWGVTWRVGLLIFAHLGIPGAITGWNIWSSFDNFRTETTQNIETNFLLLDKASSNQIEKAYAEITNDIAAKFELLTYRNRAWFPEFAEHVEADGFDFFGHADGRGGDGFGLGVVEDAEGNGDTVAMLFVAPKAKVEFLLAQAFPGNLEAGDVLLAFEKPSRGIGAFGDIFRSGIFTGIMVEELDQFSGSDDGGTAGNVLAGGHSHAGGVFPEVFHGAEFFLFNNPAAIAGPLPVGKVLVVDGRAGEPGGEEFFDGRKFIQPWEDFRTALAVEEAKIEFFANLVRTTGNLADGSARVTPRFCAFWFFRAVLNIFFVIHGGIFSWEEKNR